MELNILIRIPLLLIPFILIIRYRNSLIGWISKIKLPRILLALIVSIPLIIFEEHINCGAYGCTNVFLPPTLWFLLVMELGFFLLLKIIPIKNIIFQTVFLSTLGIIFELFIGAAHAEFQQLAFSQPATFFLLSLWVAVSYAFVLFLPLLILKVQPIFNSRSSTSTSSV